MCALFSPDNLRAGAVKGLNCDSVSIILVVLTLHVCYSTLLNSESLIRVDSVSLFVCLMLTALI